MPVAMSRENPSTSVERAVAMLDAIGARSHGMTNAEISRHLKIPKSSASYILRALEKSGYLRRVEAKYRLGLKLLSLRHSALEGLNVRDVALPHLRSLAERLRQTVHLAVWDREEAVYVEKVDAAN
ncbi:MAG: helix-turn-helix domain-containing protein, partial [Acidobacteriales bacterium]|nr:helix-turn-helix domain-containing protein [Terriglobales bacterium]